MTITLQDDGDRNRVRVERYFAHPVERVWRCVVEPEQLSVWYPATVTDIDARVGGAIRCDYGDGMVTTSTITEFDPPRVLAFVEPSLPDMEHEGDMGLRLELRAEGEGCRFVLEQVFDDRPAAASYATGWQACLEGMARLLAGEPQQEPAPFVAEYEHNVALLGLDRPEVRDGAVHLERQLMGQPVEKVWRALAPGDTPSARTLLPARIAESEAGNVRAGDRVVLELDDGGEVVWAVGGGPGGARLSITHTPGAGDPGDYVAAWRDHVAGLVGDIVASH